MYHESYCILVFKEKEKERESWTIVIWVMSWLSTGRCITSLRFPVVTLGLVAEIQSCDVRSRNQYITLGRKSGIDKLGLSWEALELVGSISKLCALTSG